MSSLSPSSRLVVAALLLAAVVAVLAAVAHPSPPPGAAGPLGTGQLTASPPTAFASTFTPASGTLTPATASNAPTGMRAPSPGSSSTPRLSTSATPPPVPSAAGCTPTDQDRYVYHPGRLAVQVACLRVTGTVAAVRYEADGDLHILLALDPAFAHLLTPANQGVELGDLVIEPVCVRPVSQADAIATCASDPDPLAGPFPVVGERVWMEGRYVFDLDHGGWAELHPLYRWGYE
jgi:hypothetical protein